MTGERVLNAEEIIAKIEKGHTWYGNILQKVAEELVIYPTEEEEIMRYDMTKRFLEELKRKIRNRELINVQVNGTVRLGKSTVAILLGKYIFGLLKTFGYRKEEEEFGIKNIARDDQEYAKMMRDPELMYNIIVTDEKNALEQTGENVTTENAQKQVYSDVQAGRYVHRISCSPKEIIDPNVDTVLEIRNRQGGLTHCRLWYRLLKGGQSQWVLLGFVDLDVSELIKRWTRIEKRFMEYVKKRSEGKKGKEMEKEEKYFKEMYKKDFYIHYMGLKYQKMELMNKEGILRPRELDYASIYLKVIEKLEPLIEVIGINQLKIMAISYLESQLKEGKIPYSVMGLDGASRRVISVLTTYKSMKSMDTKISIMARKKIGKENLAEMIKTRKEIYEIHKQQIEELKRYERINNEYQEHMK